MALTPGDGRSPSTLDKSPPSPTRSSPPRSTRPGGTPRWPRAASVAVVRLGLLFGGLVIILDLLFMLLMERTLNAEDIAGFEQVDLFLNLVLFSILGVLVVRQAHVMFAGFLAGLFAGLLDAIVVSAASLMVPPAPSLDALEFGFAQNVVIGTLFAGLSGVMFALVQRWSSGQRRR
jgi:hypothetical protein